MFKNKKIKYIEFLPIIIITIAIFKVINNFENITNTVLGFLPSLSTILWGLAIAYLLNFPMSYLERTFKIRRLFSIILVYVILLGGIALFFTNLIPQLISSVRTLLKPLLDEKQITLIIQSIQDFVNQYEFLTNFDLSENLREIITTLSSTLQNSFNSILSGIEITFTTAFSITSSFFKVMFGLIISAYVLKDKEKLTSYTNNALKSLFSEKKYDTIMFNLREVHDVFSKYIVGKSLDSFIIALLCFLGLSLTHIEYALLISLIVGITNMIPYFGPLLGMFPAAFIALVSSGQLSKGLGVLAFIIILQQLDGWLIGPKILGDSVGVDPLIIITAIIIGGAAGGILGMFISVPIAAITKANFERFLSKKQKLRSTSPDIKDPLYENVEETVSN